MIILSQKWDAALITTIGISSTLLAIALAQIFQLTEVSPLIWLLLVVGIDVAHVYSSVYRTYFARQTHKDLKPLLFIIPILCFAVGFFAALKSTSFFWSVLAYVAVFHFSRQQIGFLRIYTDIKNRKSFWNYCNEASIYIFTLGSILVWHQQGPKSFQWFIQNDFIFAQNNKSLESYLKIFILLWAVFAGFLQIYGFKIKKISLQASLLLLSTFVSWYIPIVILNSDFVFTFVNVISHGVPYMVLVYHKEKKEKTLFSRIEIFLGLLFFFAFIEEALWDSLIWREHKVFFESFYFLSPVHAGSTTNAFLLSLLILPQFVHYILDGFIWRKKYNDSVL